MLIMRKLFRFEKLGIVAGIYIIFAIVILGIFSTTEDAKSFSKQEFGLIILGLMAIFIGIMIACGILEHFEHKKAGWKRKEKKAEKKETKKAKS